MAIRASRMVYHVLVVSVQPFNQGKQKGVPCVGGAAANVQPRHVPRVLSSHQKFATAMVVAKELASLASEVVMVEFCERLVFPADVRRRWVEGSSVRLTSTCEYDLTHNFSPYKYGIACLRELKTPSSFAYFIC